MNLSKLPGVEKCNVSYKHGKATVVYGGGVTPDVDALKDAVTKLGFTPGKAVVR